MSNIKTLRLIKVQYIGPTDTLGSRIKISEEPRFSDQKKQSKCFYFDYEVGNIATQTQKILESNGWKIESQAFTMDDHFFLCDNWADDYKEIKDLK